MTRGLIAFALLLTGWIALLCDIVQLRITGLAVGGVALILVALWILGVFTRAFWNLRPRRPWVATIPEDHPDALGSLDLMERAYRQEDR